jgi:hypothetical protein
MTPLFPSFPHLSALYDQLLFSAYFLSCLAIAITGKRGPIICFLTLSAVMVMQDQLRLQPWLFEYSLLLITLILPGPNHQSGLHGRLHTSLFKLNTMCMILAAIYIWSGIHKLNASFCTIIFPFLLPPVLKLYMPPLLIWIAGCLTAALESFMGIALLTKRYRRLGLVGLTAMHAFILFSIGPTGLNHNVVVWPWNIAQPILLWLLFSAQQTSASDILCQQLGPLSKRAVPRYVRGWHSLVFSLCLIMPILHCFQLWPAYLSFALYAGNESYGYICFSERFWEKQPLLIKRCQSGVASGYHIVPLNRWSLSELNLLVPPNLQTIKSVAASVQAQAESKEDLRLLLIDRPPVWVAHGKASLWN